MLPATCSADKTAASRVARESRRLINPIYIRQRAMYGLAFGRGVAYRPAGFTPD